MKKASMENFIFCAVKPISGLPYQNKHRIGINFCLNSFFVVDMPAINVSHTDILRVLCKKGSANRKKFRWSCFNINVTQGRYIRRTTIFIFSFCIGLVTQLNASTLGVLKHHYITKRIRELLIDNSRFLIYNSLNQLLYYTI